MALRIGKLLFEHVPYDGKGDVLYLHVDEPRAALDAEETEEGHVVRYDAQGRVAGLTIVNARWLLERDGAITVTVPPLHVEARDIADLLGAAG